MHVLPAYIDPTLVEAITVPENERYWMGERGVDLYVGGVEHAVLHLLYSRFWHKVLYDLGVVGTPEPFARLFNQGYIQARRTPTRAACTSRPPRSRSATAASSSTARR